MIDCRNLSVDGNAATSFNILAISLNVLCNYFDNPNKITFRSLFRQNYSFRVQMKKKVI